MKKTTIFLALLLGVIISLSTLTGSRVQAQEPLESLDTVLARAAANTFLVTLTRPELSGTMKFYLVDSLDADTILTQAGHVTGYAINQSGW